MAKTGSRKKGGTLAPRRPQRRRKRKTFRVAITGCRSWLGERLVEALEREPACEHILALDIARPRNGGDKTRFIRVDLTHPDSDVRMAALLDQDGIDTLVHLAFLSFPSHASGWAHELEAIGSMYVMNAAASSSVRKVVMGSTTMVYGANPDNPNYLTEGHRLRGVRGSRWVKDKVAAERELAVLQRDFPKIKTTCLRFATTLGPTVRGFFPRVFSRRVLVQLMGYDPLMQFLHEEDAASALLKAVVEDHPGVFNVVGEGVLYYSQAIGLGGRVPVVVPQLLAEPATSALWNLQLVDVPGVFLSYFKYSWCADGRRMREVFGFEPRHTSRDTLLCYYDALADRRGSEAA